MAKTPFSAKKHDINTINSGYQYTTDDQMSIEALNNTIENSFYALNTAESVSKQLSNLGVNDKVEFKGSNPNILLNGNFKINQRGLPNYIANANMDIVDKWKIQTEGSFDVSTNTFTSNTRFSAIRQEVENFDSFRGKILTYSIYVKNVEENTFGVNVRDGVSTYLKDGLTQGLNTFTVTIDENATQLIFDIQNRVAGTHSIQLEYAKVELGSIATPFSPKPYEEELANCQVIKGGLATTYSNPNLLINGNFLINQRGKDYYSGAIYSVDRWTLTGSSTSFDTKTKLFQTSTQYGSIRQLFEDYASYAGKTVTLSCKISNITGSDVYLALADGSQTKQINISTDGIYSVTTTITDSPTRLVCMIYKTGTAGNLAKATIEYMKLEFGEVATSFSPRPYAEELALCQRYYLKLQQTTNYAIYWKGWFNGGTVNFDALVHTPVTFRTKPTITTNGNLLITKTTGGTLTITSFSVHYMYTNQLLVRCVSSGGTQGQECVLQANNDTTTYIEFDAEM